MIITTKIRTLLALSFGILLMLGACKKETTDFNLTVNVTVYDTVKVSNALIRVYAPVKDSYLDYYQYTDEDGSTDFTLDRKAVVEIVAGKGSFRACGFAELFNGGNSVTIDLKPFGSIDNGCP